MPEKIKNILIELEFFLSELRKILGYSFDVECSYLSIYEVFSAFPALYMILHKLKKKILFCIKSNILTLRLADPLCTSTWIIIISSRPWPVFQNTKPRKSRIQPRKKVWPTQRISETQLHGGRYSAFRGEKRDFLFYAWESYLPCSKRSENLINRKIGTFYIEAIPQNFSQLRQKIFFRARSKYFLDFPGIRGFSKGFLIKPL